MIDSEEVLDPAASPDEPEIDRQLRPRRLAEFVGQQQVKDQLEILMEAARLRSEPVEHLLLCGPPGLGKTTLANIVAAEMGVSLRITSGPAIEFQGALASLLTSLGDGDVLFIDEVHRLQRTVEESLYPAMEDFAFDFVSGKGAGAQSMRLALQRFTVIGATTREGMLSAPLRDRFGATFRLEFYEPQQLRTILARSARLLQVEAEPAALDLISGRSRGTPRIANRLLRRVRDYSQVRGQGELTLALAEEALRLLEVDRIGLTNSDRRLLGLICEQFGGGPVGLSTIGAALAEEPHTIEEVIEPYLIQLGMLKRTPRGRMAMAGAYRHLGLAVPELAQNPTAEVTGRLFSDSV
jgi:Holliday junction DNA helicase RuvB